PFLPHFDSIFLRPALPLWGCRACGKQGGGRIAMATDSVLAVIPARVGSTRFPGKVMADIGGKPLVWHTYQRAMEARLIAKVVVATDAPEVAEPLKALGIPVVMTRADHPSGTDRIAEVAL